jgi:hypothetical protein
VRGRPPVRAPRLYDERDVQRLERRPGLKSCWASASDDAQGGCWRPRGRGPRARGVASRGTRAPTRRRECRRVASPAVTSVELVRERRGRDRALEEDWPAAPPRDPGACASGRSSSKRNTTGPAAVGRACGRSCGGRPGGSRVGWRSRHDACAGVPVGQEPGRLYQGADGRTGFPAAAACQATPSRRSMQGGLPMPLVTSVAGGRPAAQDMGAAAGRAAPRRAPSPRLSGAPTAGLARGRGPGGPRRARMVAILPRRRAEGLVAVPAPEAEPLGWMPDGRRFAATER